MTDEEEQKSERVTTTTTTTSTAQNNLHKLLSVQEVISPIPMHDVLYNS